MNLFNIFRRNTERTEDQLKLVMTVDGHRLYQFVSIESMPFFRENIIRIGYAKMELGIRQSDLLVMYDNLIEYVNEGRLDKIATLVNHAKWMTQSFGSSRIALEIGGYATIVDDEPLDGLRQKHVDIKEKLVEKHPAVRDFFLSESVRFLLSLNSTIEQQLSAGFMSNPYRIQREKMFLELIQKDTFNELWMPVILPPSGWQKILEALSPKKY